jgi:hypothetical protein
MGLEMAMGSCIILMDYAMMDNLKMASEMGMAL